MNKSNPDDLSNSKQDHDSNLLDKSNNDLIKRKNLKALKIKKAKNSDNSIRKGKWDKEEHYRFLEICLKHGNNWPKVNFNWRQLLS